ncbi:MAG TPA: hypothetical protein VK669_01805 [Candidatus Limnocylindrales bacterium]|nr:hypothetical protein [Candidatus Limnocylindrales bacterium]
MPRVTAVDATRLAAYAVPRPFELVQVLGSALLGAAPAVLTNARQSSQQFYVDPDTERLAFPIVVGATKALQQLLSRYTGVTPAPAQLQQPWLASNRNTFTANAINFQRTFAPSGIQAPSFSFANSSDAWFNESVLAATRTAAILTAQESLIIQISAQSNAISAAHDRAAIVRAYQGLPVALFVLQIIHDDEKSAPIADSAYIDLVKSLSQQAPVIPSKLGFFGFICVANGAAGFGAGIIGVEEHSEPVLRTGGGPQTTTKYHVDDVMMVLPPERVVGLTLPSYPCVRPCCNGNIATTLDKPQKYQHRIRVYRERLDAIGLSGNARNYVRTWLASATSLRQSNGLIEVNPAARMHESSWRPLV